MTDLAEFLTRPPLADENCGLWLARWLAESGHPDILAGLDRDAVAAAWRVGAVLAFAQGVFSRPGWRVTSVPVPGDPVCCQTPAGETMGIAIGPRRSAFMTAARGVFVAPFPILEAWTCRR